LLFLLFWVLLKISRVRCEDGGTASGEIDKNPASCSCPALWDRWRSADKPETKETFTIITTEPSKFAAQFHNRMPLILELETWDAWLKGDSDAAAALMRPANEDVLVSRPVTKAVGSVRNNGPKFLEAAQ